MITVIHLRRDPQVHCHAYVVKPIPGFNGHFDSGLLGTFIGVNFPSCPLNLRSLWCPLRVISVIRGQITNIRPCPGQLLDKHPWPPGDDYYGAEWSNYRPAQQVAFGIFVDSDATLLWRRVSVMASQITPLFVCGVLYGNWGGCC